MVSIRLAIISGALVLTGCNEKQREICSPIPDRIAYAPPFNAAQVRENVNRCVQHWAARLSFSSDPAETVAKAAIAACKEGMDDALSFAGGEPVEYDAGPWEKRLYDLALFRAVQQRAGDCGIPELGEMPPPDKGSPRPKAPPRG